MKITFRPDRSTQNGMMLVEAENDNERAILRVFLDGASNGYDLIVHSYGGAVATSYKGEDQFVFGWRKPDAAEKHE